MQGKSRVRATEEPTFLKAVQEDFLNEAACKGLDKILGRISNGYDPQNAVMESGNPHSSADPKAVIRKRDLGYIQASQEQEAPERPQPL